LTAASSQARKRIVVDAIEVHSLPTKPSFVFVFSRQRFVPPLPAADRDRAIASLRSRLPAETGPSRVALTLELAEHLYDATAETFATEFDLWLATHATLASTGPDQPEPRLDLTPVTSVLEPLVDTPELTLSPPEHQSKALYLLALAYEETSHPEPAIATWTRLTALPPNALTGEAHFRKGELELAADRLPAAMKSYVAALSSPSAPTASWFEATLLKLGWTAMQLGDLPRALTAYDRLLTHLTPPPAPSPTAPAVPSPLRAEAIDGMAFAALDTLTPLRASAQRAALNRILPGPAPHHREVAARAGSLARELAMPELSALFMAHAARLTPPSPAP